MRKIALKREDGMKKNVFWGFIAAVVFVALILLPAGCTKKETSAEESEPIEETESSPEATEEILFTRENPGPWAGKEDVHVPQIRYERTETGARVVVSLSHEMNPETPHYIMRIQLKDGLDNLLAENIFQPQDKKAEAVIELGSLPARLKALAKCNLHGTWLEEVEVSIEQ
jgi:desulfoferrodoxin-like iron-binding protein